MNYVTPTPGGAPQPHNTVVVIDSTTGYPVGHPLAAPVTANITTRFREAFEMYTPNSGGKWLQTVGSGDIVMVDGNAAAASYLVISKDPLTSGTVTEIETVARFSMPIEMAVGLSMSQRTLGQEFAVEVVSDETIARPTDITIASISQATTTLTINTALPHGLTPGRRIGVRACTDPRLNYPAIVVASIPSPTQITCTAGPNGALPSFTAGPLASGVIFHRSALGSAENGTSMIFNNGTATNASFYVRSEAGDALPSGTPAGIHTVTVGNTTGTPAITAPYTYAWQPSIEYKLTMMADRIQWSDAPVDTLSTSFSRLSRSQVVPDPSALYKLRIRATNNASLTVPTAQIVSVSKAGSTTATIVFDRPHGLTATDVFVAYGVRDQTNFANLVVSTAVASIVDATTITALWGPAVTATSYGGYVARVNANNFMSGLGQTTIVCASATLTNGILTLTGNANWFFIAVGDYVNAIGVRNNVNGAALGVDGAYRVRSVATTVLELERIDGVTQPADFAATDCGGTVIKRTDMRISFARVFDFQRERVEIMTRPTGDLASAIPVLIQGGTTTVAGTITVGSVTTAGTPTPPTNYSSNSAATTNGALIVTATTGVQAVFATNNGAGAAYVKLYNKATAPTVGTDVPEMLIPVPAALGGVPGVSAPIDCGFNGLRFPLGLGIAITGGAADNDTTAVTAGQVKVKISRTV